MKALVALFIATATLALAAPSGSPSPPPSGDNMSGTGRSSQDDAPEFSFYNDGVKFLFQKQWAAAEKQFNAAVAVNPKMAEAHNNLAYVLRKQGEQNYEKSLQHYSRAIELKPKLAEAYMYRGALHSMMGHADLAKADLATLVKLKTRKSKELAKHLQKIFDTGKEEEPEQFYGVAKKK